MKKALSVILMIFFIQPNAQDMKEAYFASGCFWCVESIYESLIGVDKVESGYSGGYTKNPTYYTVLTGRTGHAEAIKVYYDSNKISFNELVKVFFGSHDPTTLNRQGPDRGTHYRSIAFYSNENEKKIINEEIKRLLNNKTYQKIKKRRKRYLCVGMDDRRKYLFLPHAKVQVL